MDICTPDSVILGEALRRFSRTELARQLQKDRASKWVQNLYNFGMALVGGIFCP